MKSMQSLIAEHGKKIVAGGALSGQMYESIELEKLRKVAKRYKADPSFSKVLHVHAWPYMNSIRKRNLVLVCQS